MSDDRAERASLGSPEESDVEREEAVPEREDRRRTDRRRVSAELRRTERLARVRTAIRNELADDAGPSLVSRARADDEGRLRPVIELQHVYLAFDYPVLEDVSLVAHEGETIVIVGESGTGKSTILKLILRLLVPDQGHVLVDGEDIAHLSFEEALEVRQDMGMVFQGAALFDSMTVFDNVA
ncbi:MAG TPA: ATP-binding cassette domain-containing protein, partial [Gemmatimonadaceae bacterium]|nr:ATP-binding cassette domain-containing protein [Gemmatimonadaceae bacterium]